MFLFEKHGALYEVSERQSMATYHCQIKAPRQKSAGKHADYVQCEGRYKSKLEEREHVEHGNMPTWAQDNAKDFWKAADEFERANGQTYKEIEVALPRELTPSQRQEIVREFVKKELSAHAYTWAIHNKKASDGQMQPHAHIMFSPRQQDKIERSREQYFKRANSKEPAKGGCKKSDRWAGSLSVQAKNVEKVRERWAEAVNRSYEKAGRAEKVDHRSLADQGIDRLPEKHMGPAATAMIERNDGFEVTRKQAHNRSVRAYNRSRSIVTDLAAAKQQETTIKGDISRLEVKAGIAQENATLIRKHLQQVKEVQPVRAPVTNGNAPTTAVKENTPTPQPPAVEQLTNVEIKAVLLDYSSTLEKRENEIEAERKAIPAKAEDIQTSLIYRDVPEWHQWDKQEGVVKGADQQCQQRMALWRQEGKENKWSVEKGPLLIGRDEYKDWKARGEAIKEWRGKIDEGLEKHETRRQELQERTNKLPNLETETAELVSRRQALGKELSEVQNTRREISSVYQNFPKDTTPYTVKGKTGPAIMADKDLLQEIKDRKVVERNLEKSRGISHGR